MDTLYRKLDLVERLNLSIGTIDNHMNKGTLRYLKIGKSVRFTEADVNEWVSKYYTKKHIAKILTEEQIDRLQKITGEE